MPWPRLVRPVVCRCDTIALKMRILVLLLLAASSIAAQNSDEEFRIYGSSPRLLLNAQRLRLLRRERDRQSMRWQQFQTLVTGKAVSPEPGLFLALYFIVSGDKAYGRQAIDWALSPANTDLRQLALVFDWCGDLLSESETALLATKVQRGIALTDKARDVPTVRSRIFGAIALADRQPEKSDALLAAAVQQWFRKDVLVAEKAGKNPIKLEDYYALYEILHVIRDNLKIDLRDSAPAYFKELPSYHVMAHYPAPYPAAENEFRIPVYTTGGEPDLRKAALSRIAGLSMVAFDTNALSSQFLQGWLMQDRFMLRGIYGAPYEYIWANPYQPGLSFSHIPLILHDPVTGHLVARSSWEEDADWFANVGRQLQRFNDGSVHVLDPKTLRTPLRIGPAVIVGGLSKFAVSAPEPTTLFVLGLQPRKSYDIEIDDREMHEEESDAAGTIELKLPYATTAGVRLKLKT